MIDDVRIYNYARTQDQIIEDMNAGHPAGGSPVGSPVAYWKFDEGVSDTANDSVGADRGTLDADTGGTNTTETEMWSLEAKKGKAIEFDGTDDYIDITSISGIPDVGDDITISSWYKFAGTMGDAYDIVTIENASTTDAIQLAVDSGNVQAWKYDGTVMVENPSSDDMNLATSQRVDSFACRSIWRSPLLIKEPR